MVLKFMFPIFSFISLSLSQQPAPSFMEKQKVSLKTKGPVVSVRPQKKLYPASVCTFSMVPAAWFYTLWMHNSYLTLLITKSLCLSVVNLTGT